MYVRVCEYVYLPTHTEPSVRRKNRTSVLMVSPYDQDYPSTLFPWVFSQKTEGSLLRFQVSEVSIPSLPDPKWNLGVMDGYMKGTYSGPVPSYWDGENRVGKKPGLPLYLKPKEYRDISIEM